MTFESTSPMMTGQVLHTGRITKRDGVSTREIVLNRSFFPQATLDQCLTRREITAFLESDNLDPDFVDSASKHLSECADCRERLKSPCISREEINRLRDHVGGKIKLSDFNTSHLSQCRACIETLLLKCRVAIVPQIAEVFDAEMHRFDRSIPAREWVMQTFYPSYGDDPLDD